MKKIIVICDVCGEETFIGSGENLIKRRMVRVKGMELEVTIVVTGWSAKNDICKDCAVVAYKQAKQSLMVEQCGDTSWSKWDK